MKKNIIFLLLSFVLTIVNVAQEVSSFRSKALGGIIDDDLELAYDAIELSFLDKTRLYTHLSNLAGNNEKFLANQSDNEFLLGVSRNKFISDKLSVSGLIRFNYSKLANPLSIDSDMDGIPDITGNGSINSTNTVYLDTDGDGIYDTKRTIDESATDYITNNNHSFIINASYRTDRKIWGVKVSHTKNKIKTTIAPTDLGTGSGILTGVSTGDPSFTHDFTSYLLIKDYLNMEWNESGDFDTKDRYSNTSIQIAMLTPDYKSYELRTDLLFSLVNNTINTIDNYKGYVQNYYQEISGYKSIIDEHNTFNMITKDNGFIADLGASIRKNLTDLEERKNQGFWIARLDLFYGYFNYENSSEYHLTSVDGFFDGGGVLYTDYDQNIDTLSTINDEGKRHEMGLLLSGRINYPFSEKLYFGIGANVNASINKRTTAYSDSAKTTELYTQYDATLTNDFQRLSQLMSKYDNHYDIFLITSMFPVGLECKIGKNNKWAARIGAIFTYTFQNIRDAQQFVDGIPYSSTTTYANTQVDVALENMETNSTSKESTTITNVEVFTYGLGFIPTEYLQIDLLGFFDNTNTNFLETDFYRNLLLSITLKF